jgi:hypothetical protein
MIILATRKGETVEIHYNSFGQLRNIVRHSRRWSVVLSRANLTNKK